jgi:hypothetical protein
MKKILFGLMVIAALSSCHNSGVFNTGPTAPIGVTAVSAGGQVTISWPPVVGATSYNLYWSKTSGVTTTTGTKITGVTSPYILSGLTNGTTYYYVVTAVNSGGESVASSQVSATPSLLPVVLSTFPANFAQGIALNAIVSATFNHVMNTSTITSSTFTVSGGVTGNVVYDVATNTGTFSPTSLLAPGTLYTATITTGATDIAGNALSASYSWSFTTASAGVGPAPVYLGTAGTYVILAKTEVTNVPTSAITGNVGLSPAAESYYTGFAQADGTGFAVSTQVTGFMYAANMASPTPANLTTAVSDMQTAYTDAAGRTTSTPAASFLNLGAGTLSGNTLTPGTYTWGTGLAINGNITISGGAQDTWIFQIAGNLTVGNGVQIILNGGAQAKNIVWQLAGEATLGTTVQFEGIILSKTAINLQTGATLNGRALAQSGVTLQSNAITTP